MFSKIKTVSTVLQQTGVYNFNNTSKQAFSQKGVQASYGRPLFDKIHEKCTSSFKFAWRNVPPGCPCFNFWLKACIATEKFYGDFVESILLGVASFFGIIRTRNTVHRKQIVQTPCPSASAPPPLPQHTFSMPILATKETVSAPAGVSLFLKAKGTLGRLVVSAAKAVQQNLCS